MVFLFSTNLFLFLLFFFSIEVYFFNSTSSALCKKIKSKRINNLLSNDYAIMALVFNFVKIENL